MSTMQEIVKERYGKAALVTMAFEPRFAAWSGKRDPDVRPT